MLTLFAPPRLGTLSESMMRAFHDIGSEHIVSTELMMANFKEGEKPWHFNYDG
jgi:hypothetical protein